MAEELLYDLTVQPWVRVLRTDGTAEQLSLTGVIELADSVRAIAGEIATQDTAILRLILAILHRALEPYAPDNPSEVAGMIVVLRNQWDDVVVPAVRRYLTEHRARMDLFGPRVPFFQVARMSTAKGEFSPLSKLIADMPAGSPYLTGRSAKAALRIEAAEAARWLVHVQAYDASGIKTGVVGHPRANGGRVYPEGPAWTGQLGLIHLVGPTLKETLLLNLWAVLLPYDARQRDLPPWEGPPQSLQSSPELLHRPAGPVDLYTWQARRVLLCGGPEGVTGVLITYGDRIIMQDHQEVLNLEPMSLWRFSKPQTQKLKRDIQMTRRHMPGVSLWRGLAALVPPTSTERSTSARNTKPAHSTALIDHAVLLVKGGAIEESMLRYRAVGVEYGSQESVIDEIVDDALDVPATVLDPAHVDLRQTALDAVESAKAGVAALAEFARGLARAAGAGGDATDGPGDRAYEEGYAVLDLPYRTWLRGALADPDVERLDAEHQWHATARRELRALADGLAAAAPEKAWRGFGAGGKREDVGVAYQRFERKLNAAFPRAFVPS